MLSTVMIIPDADREAANVAAEVLGLGPNNFSVALSADGSEPATHWGLHAWWNEPPEIVGAVVSTRDRSRGHFADVCEENGLRPGAEASSE